MTRTTAVNFAGGLQFPLANAATDLFKKEDVQTLASAVDLHDHTSGKGLVLPATAIPDGSITSAKIADATIQTIDLADAAVTGPKLAVINAMTVALLTVTVTTNTADLLVGGQLHVSGASGLLVDTTATIGSSLSVTGPIAGGSTLTMTGTSRLQGGVAIGPQGAPASALSIAGASPNVPPNTLGIGYSIAATAGAQTALRGPLKGGGASGPAGSDAVNWWIINLGGTNVYVPYFI